MGGPNSAQSTSSGMMGDNDMKGKSKKDDLDEDKSFKITRGKTATLTENKKKRSCKC